MASLASLILFLCELFGYVVKKHIAHIVRIISACFENGFFYMDYLPM